MRYILFFIFLVSINTYALSFLSKDERYQNKTIVNTIKENDGNKVKKSDDDLVKKLLSELKRSNKKIEHLSQRKKIVKKQNPSTIVMLGKKKSIGMLDEFDGKIYDSVLAVSDETTRIKVKLSKNKKFDTNALLRCFGTLSGFRLKGYCDRLIVKENTYSVKVLLKDIYDGVDSLYCDDMYSGEEEAFTKDFFSGFLGGVIDASKDRIITPWGETEKNNAKNKILSGLLGAAPTINNNLKKDVNQIKSVCILYSGKRIIAQFDEGVSL